MRRTWLVGWLMACCCVAQAQDAAEVITLQEALDTARAYHPQLREAEAATDLALGVAEASRAPLLPQLSGTASYQRTTSNFVFRPGNNINAFMVGMPRANSNQTFNFYNMGVTVTQLLYDFGQSLDGWRASKEDARAQSVNEQAVQLTVDFDLRNAFFTARANRAQVLIAQETVRNQERHRQQIQAFVDAGTRPEIDLVQVEVDLANARVQLIQAESTYETSRANLNQAMGIERSTLYDVADQSLPPIPEEDFPAADLLALAAKERPELRVLALQAKAQRYSERATKGLYGPSINASGNFLYAGTDLDRLTWNWNVGASLNWTPWQGGIVRAQLRQVRANLASIAAQADVLRQQVLQQLEQARLAVRAQRAVLEVSGQVVDNARLRLGLAEGNYAQGVGDIIALEDAQLALTTAQVQQVQAEYNLAIARAQLLNALGRPE